MIIPPSSLQTTLNKFTVTTPPASADDPFHSPSNGIEGNFDFDAQIESDITALDNITPEQDCVDGVKVDEIAEQIKSHHVSCEDLLEFADAKPSSRARGNDSDQVRILLKVFRNEVKFSAFLELLRYCNCLYSLGVDGTMFRGSESYGLGGAECGENSKGAKGSARCCSGYVFLRVGEQRLGYNEGGAVDSTARRRGGAGVDRRSSYQCCF